ncbi:glycosyltransferase [Calothrix sp. PCC 7507]|uniref:glycosyltransferase n=1 Tax=Calothrix sp. PCC 7507 TaxID=99598 RepID=UPI00029EECD4|nr:glycosyltransferase [Calothrix sp. PCC 7507]AFY35407.1 glycosyl transferase group 1 [Calothrix sp. PCC 7507]
MSTVTPFSSVSEFINLLETRKQKFYTSVVYNPPVVSIISSFFNAHEYFAATYESVINQTWQNFEWIIVDDRSTSPDAIALFDSLPAKSAKIKTLYHQTNRGLAAGRNKAIAHARGKYLFFMDLDDLLDPTCIEKCVLFLETHPEFSFVNSYSVGFQAQEYWWTHGFNQPSQFIHQNWITGRLLYRKSDFDCLGGFDENLRFYEDWERWLKAITNNQKGWTIPEYLDCYRRLDSGLLTTSRANITEEKRIAELIRSRHQDFFNNNYIPDITIHRCDFVAHSCSKNIDIVNSLEHNESSVLCFFPHLEVGGADKFNIDLVTLLAARGYELTIITTSKSAHPWQKHFYEVTADIFHLCNFLKDSDWLSFIKYIIKSRQINIVFISNSYIAYYFLPLLRHEFPDVVFVDFTHTIDPGWRGCGYPRLSCQFSQFLDWQIVSSHHLAEYYRCLNPQTAEKLQVCHTNINTDKWVQDKKQRQEVRSHLQIPDDAVVILFPARLVEQKRPLLLIDIFQELVNRSLNITIIVVGNGHLLPEMQAKIHHYGLESHFHILPAINPEEMFGIYCAVDILLLPSAYEGISLVIYEAMSMQLPVVASDVGGQAELVIPGTGFLVPKADNEESEVKEYLKVLIPLIKDSELRSKIGYYARQRVVELFSLDKMGERIDVLFTEAIALCQTKSQPNADLALAEETLLIALEYLHQEQVLNQFWRENNLLREERHELAWKKRAMESSKFWKFRRLWFKLKRSLHLTQEEEI